jgi:excisionase family DNA binding protein
VSADASNGTAQALISGQFAARSLSLAQAREALGVSRRTLYYWIKRGRLQTVRTSMGSQRVLVASVKEHWLVRN